MAPSAADVPSKFDILIDGKGYVYHDAFTGGSSSNVPEKGIFTYTPTFVTRQNTQGNYGDNQQDFWLTYSQKDWSLGEKQRFQGRDENSVRKFWQGTAVDVSVPGKVSMRKTTNTFTPAAAITAWGRRGYSAAVSGSDIVYTTSTNLYSITPSGSISDAGAHGYATSPSCMATDGVDVYFSKGSAGVGIRAWDGTTFTTFSDATTTGQRVDSLAFLNNTLYGFKSATDTLYSFSTVGVSTAAFTWKAADGGAGSAICVLQPFGSKLAILRTWSNEKPSTLHIYDGVGVSLLNTFPDNFFASSMVVLNGVIFVGGHLMRATSGTNLVGRSTIYYYANGQPGIIWQADGYTTTGGTWSGQGDIDGATRLAVFDGGLVFGDDYRGAVMFYDFASGAFSTLFTYSPPNNFTDVIGSTAFLIFDNVTGASARTYYPSLTTTATTATVTSSLIDFDSSLTKIFRGIKVDFDSASDGNGGSVDIAYRVGDVDGSYTSLQTGATSGTEYNLSGVSGRSISVKITLNKGTSTNGPVLKRIYIRAVPVQQNFERFKVVLNCTGRAEPGVNDPQYIELRDGSVHNKDGLQMATDLRSAAESTSPISVTTKFGTLSNCIIEDLSLSEIRPNEFVGEATVREV